MSDATPKLQIGGDEHAELLLAFENADGPPACAVFIINSESAKIRKQVAARLAKAMSLQLTPISLDALKSDVPGETEASLRAFFERAVASNWVLFFDEADALFGNKPARDVDLSSVVRELLIASDACAIVGTAKVKASGRFWKDVTTLALVD
jgi:hypothetical protein